MSHTQIGRLEEVDSRLLVVGSQTASLTPGPSFAHNLGCRRPNCQCEVIFDIYVSRPFQWHQEHPNARFFSPCCRALNIWESRKTPNLQLFQVLGFTPTLGQSGVATGDMVVIFSIPQRFWVNNMWQNLFMHDGSWSYPFLIGYNITCDFEACNFFFILDKMSMWIFDTNAGVRLLFIYTHT